MSTSLPRRRSLWPREHGAYIQLLVPLAAALVAVPPPVAGAAIALGAGLGFLASEPLRVALGDRGPRLREVAGARARRRFVGLGLGAVIAGGTGLTLAPVASVAAAGLIALPVSLVLVWSRRGTVHTVLGESVAAIALSGAATPVAVAGGVSLRLALVIWVGWSIAYAMTVLAVHHVIWRHRRSSAGGRGLALPVLAAVLVALIATQALWFVVPLGIVAVIVRVLPPRATRLRAVGIAFLVGSLASAAWEIAMIQAGPATPETSQPAR